MAAVSGGRGPGDVTSNDDCGADKGGVGDGAADADAEGDFETAEDVPMPAAGFDTALAGGAGAEVHESARAAVSRAIAVRRISEIARRSGLAGEPGEQLAESASRTPPRSVLAVVGRQTVPVTLHGIGGLGRPRLER